MPKTKESSSSSSSIVSEVVAASIGGALSSSILYPLEVVKTRMQAVDDDDDFSSSSKDDNKQDEEEGEECNNSNNNIKKNKNEGMIAFAQKMYTQHGWKIFFRGFEASALQSSLEKALYFFSYTVLQKAWQKATTSSSNSGKQQTSVAINLLLGYIAEWSHLPLTLPLDAWTTEIQTSSNNKTKNTTTTTTTTTTSLQILLALLADKKNKSLYTGWSAYFLLCWKPAIQYTVYEQLKAWWLLSLSSTTNKEMTTTTTTTRSLTAAQAFGLGMLARAVASLVTFPFLRAKILQQTTSSLGQRRRRRMTVQEVLQKQYKQHGILSGWYQGVGPELTRGVMSAALMLMIKERVGGVLVRRRRQRQVVSSSKETMA